jgi:hypothetical protein
MEEDEIQAGHFERSDYTFDKFDTDSFVDLGYIQASNYNYS